MRLAVVVTFCLAASAHAKGIRLTGVTQVHPAKWGLVAQGSGQLRILPAGSAKWQTVHAVRGGSLYRVAFDDAGRLLASWEKEPHFHLFLPRQKQHRTFALPPAPAPEFKYGFNVEDLYFTADGTAAIVYMHGFIGGRTWSTVAYHYPLDGGSPTLLYRQDGHSLHNTPRLAVYAQPEDPQSPCEDNSCHPLGAITGWEIAGAKATRRVLLAPAPKNSFSRVRSVGGGGDDLVAVAVTEHPHKRHLLRWRLGEPAAFGPTPPGPVHDTEAMLLTKSGELVEAWLTDERGIELRRHGKRVEVTSLPPHPRRTPNDRPLFDVSGMIERKNGDVMFLWGEHYVHVPSDGPARRLDLRPLFKGNREFAGNVYYVREPEGFWVAYGAGSTFDFVHLSFADFQARAKPY